MRDALASTQELSSGSCDCSDIVKKSSLHIKAIPGAINVLIPEERKNNH
jgi:hypothetical protein